MLLRGMKENCDEELREENELVNILTSGNGAVCLSAICICDHATHFRKEVLFLIMIYKAKAINY